MNCKPGDMAIVIKDSDGYCASCGKPAVFKLAGKITQVTTLMNDIQWKLAEPLRFEVHGPCGNEEMVAFAIADQYLKPLRNDPGQDETLQWAPTPTKETTS